MNEVEFNLVRDASTADGTPGDITLIVDPTKTWPTIEKPWLDDAPDISCIPKGRYRGVWLWSDKHKAYLYHLVGVPNRSAVELHSANVHPQLLGCVAIGHKHQTFAKDSIAPGMPPRDMIGVTESKIALSEFHTVCRDSNGVQRAIIINIS